MATHVTEHRVRFHELDPYDHVNHAMYVTYFEMGRVEALESIGLGLDTMKSQGFHFVITQLTVRFRRAARSGDRLAIRTTVSEFARVSTVWTQEVRRLRDEQDDVGELIATANVRVAVTDTSGKPTRPPETLFETLRLLD